MAIEITERLTADPGNVDVKDACPGTGARVNLAFWARSNADGKGVTVTYSINERNDVYFCYQGSARKWLTREATLDSQPTLVEESVLLSRGSGREVVRCRVTAVVENGAERADTRVRITV